MGEAVLDDDGTGVAYSEVSVGNAVGVCVGARKSDSRIFLTSTFAAGMNGSAAYRMTELYVDEDPGRVVSVRGN